MLPKFVVVGLRSGNSRELLKASTVDLLFKIGWFINEKNIVPSLGVDLELLVQ